MDKDLNFHVYLGTVRGVLAYSNCKTNVKVENKYALSDAKEEITALEWGHKENEIIVGNKVGSVSVYDTISLKFEQNITKNIEGDGAVVGLGVTKDVLHVGRHNGVINSWNGDSNDVFKLNLNEEATMECMAHNKTTNIVAVGGEKNDLKLIDMEKQEIIFKAKSMGHDMLNLPIATSIRGILFLTNENDVVACCTKEGHVLLYDQRAQRRPVTKYHEVKACYTTITSAHRERECLVGTTKGYLQLIDLRAGKCMKTFKSFTGGITSIVCDPVYPYVTTTCLDRHLRVHNLDTKELIYKEYVKLGLTKVLMKPIIKIEAIPKDEDAEEEVDEEYEDMFNNLEVVMEKRKFRQSTEKRKKKKSLD